MNRLRTRLRASIASGPLVLLDFISGGLDPRVTFTRGSNATLVDSTGKITYAPANLALYSQDLTNWTADGANVTSSTEIAPDGTATATLLTAASGNNRRFRTTTFPVGVAVIFSVYVKQGTATTIQTDVVNQVAGPTFTFATQIYSGGIGATNHTVTPLANGWFRLSFKLTITTASIGPGVAMSGAAVGSTVLVWGQQAEPVTYQTAPSTYNPTTTAAYYGPRFDYDPVTLAAKGLLIEQQRTNLQTYSEQFDNAIWSAGTLTIATNTTVSPDGTSSADTGTRPTTGATENMRRATTAQAVNTAVTLTVYVKANTAGARLYLRNLAVDNTTTTGVVQFNPADGTISTTYGSAYVGKATMTAAGNGWYRCSITGTTPAVIATNFIDIGVTDGTSAVGGVAGNSIFIWGAQLEAGAFATSYIPTVASQVTRSADIASMTGTNFSSWYNQTEGTFVTSADTAGAPTVAGFTFIASDGTQNERVQTVFEPSAITSTVIDGNVTQANFTASYTINQPAKAAIAYKVNDFAASFNGSAATTDTSGTLPTVNRMTLGSSWDGLNFYLNGHIRQIAYYNTRLPDATLQELTAPSLAITLNLDFINGTYDA
jgi:hypothetical protein